MSHYHCVVWIDHKEAQIIQFDPDDADASVVHPKAKHEHLQTHAPALAARVVSVETVDHPTDGELLKFARRHFVADDRMRAQT